jgi:DNA-binding PadR family transcriptional regulator
MLSFRRLRQRFHSRVRDHHGGDHHGAGHRMRGHKMFDAGALRYIVLQMIAEQPRHGYEIIKAIEQRVGGGYCPSPGVIYPLLAMLEDMGHVVVTPDGNKKLHAITPEGRSFLDENRGFVEAITARMSDGGRHGGHGAHGHGHGSIRSSLHELKVVVVERVRGEMLPDEQLKQIQTILERATQDIRNLR